MPRNINQTPEEAARDRIDERLRHADWLVQNNDGIDFNAGPGVAKGLFRRVLRGAARK